MAGEDQATALAELRGDIDRLDREMHERLMERGRIIDRLIAVKSGTAATGSAFRPEREASMIRAMARRHEGGLPFDAVESIWRIIITTFTHLQAPFAVNVDVSDDVAAMRDSTRFHFGFMVPLAEQTGPAAVIAAVAASRGDLGLVSLHAAGAWWRALAAEGAPKVIARLPFVERADHPAALPVLVVAKTVSGEGIGAVTLYAARGLAADAGPALTALGGDILASDGDDALVAVPRELGEDRLREALSPRSLAFVGSHPSAAPA